MQKNSYLLQETEIKAEEYTLPQTGETQPLHYFLLLTLIVKTFLYYQSFERNVHSTSRDGTAIWQSNPGCHF